MAGTELGDPPPFLRQILATVHGFRGSDVINKNVSPVYISSYDQRFVFIRHFGKWIGNVLQMGFLDFHVLETYIGRMEGNFKFRITSCFRRESFEIPFVVTAFSCLRIFCMLYRYLLLAIFILLWQKDLKFYSFFRFADVLTWMVRFPPSLT